MNEERREHRRIQVFWMDKNSSEASQRVWLVSQRADNAQEVYSGIVADVSNGGLQILIGHEDAIEDEEFELIIHPPEHLGIPEITLTAKKQWDSDKGSSVFKAVGVKIDESDSNREQLSQLTNALENSIGSQEIHCEIVFSNK